MGQIYDIQVTSNTDSSLEKPFQTYIKITANNRKEKDQLSEVFHQDDYFLITYQNPIFWLVNLSPMYVCIRKYQSDMDSSNQLIKVNEEMVFNFKRKSHRKYFERVVVGVLTKFIDRIQSDLNQKIRFLHKEELLSD